MTDELGAFFNFERNIFVGFEAVCLYRALSPKIVRGNNVRSMLERCIRIPQAVDKIFAGRAEPNEDVEGTDVIRHIRKRGRTEIEHDLRECC